VEASYFVENMCLAETWIFEEVFLFDDLNFWFLWEYLAA